MDNKEISGTSENLELRITEMKSQFQKSYDVFINAHEQLSKISFDPSVWSPSSGDAGPINQLKLKDVDDILAAGSVDACISTLREKIKEEAESKPTTIPEVTRMLSIMDVLQTDIESLTESQQNFTQLVDDVNQEMSLFEARMESTMNQLDDLAVDGSDASRHDEFSDCEEEEDSELFGSEISEWTWIKEKH